MMGPKPKAQAALFCEFSVEDHIPPDHLLRAIEQFTDAEKHSCASWGFL